MNDDLIFAAATRFEAARHVPVLPGEHRSRRLHGHSFLATVRAHLPSQFGGYRGAEVSALEGLLRACVAPLDYDLLNSHVEVPTDENIARWIKARLGLPNVDNIGIQSTDGEGADLDGDEIAHIWRRYSFQGAHQLPRVPAGHKCGQMHGHGFEVIVHVRQPTSGKHMGVDYDHIDRVVQPVLAQLDHQCLNEIDGLSNPTSELISSWLWHRLANGLPELAWVTVYETSTCGAHFDGFNYRIWKELTLDSAVRLKRAPESGPASRIHGHTYTLRLHLNAPLDQVMGWTIDFGDVKELFTPVFKMLDHQPLYMIDDLEDNDIPTLLRWLKAKTAAQLPSLSRMDLYQTKGCGAILSWGGEPPALPV